MKADITVALTSTPPRFVDLPKRLEAILSQRPTQLVVTLPRSYRRFPEWDGALPRLPDGVTLLRSEDFGPATKIRAVAKADTDADILIADDDCIYGPGWLEAFRAARAMHPKAAIAASTFDTTRLGLAPGGTIVQGFAGVLLKPNWLLPLGSDDLACWVDDIWLSASLAAHKVPIVTSAEARKAVLPLKAPYALQNAEIEGSTRAHLNRQVARAYSDMYGLWI